MGPKLPPPSQLQHFLAEQNGRYSFLIIIKFPKERMAEEKTMMENDCCENIVDGFNCETCEYCLSVIAATDRDRKAQAERNEQSDEDGEHISNAYELLREANIKRNDEKMFALFECHGRNYHEFHVPITSTAKKRKTEDVTTRRVSSRVPVPRSKMLGSAETTAEPYVLECPFLCRFKTHSTYNIEEALRDIKTHYLDSEACRSVREKKAVVVGALSRRTM